MQQFFRFIQRVEQAITPTFNQLIVVGDTVLSVFRKIQGLLVSRSLRAVLTTLHTGGSSTNSDQTVLSLTIPAGYSQVADIYRTRIFGVQNKPKTGGATLKIWIKVNGVKTVICRSTTGNFVNYPFNFEGMIIVSTIAANGVVNVGGRAQFSTNSTTGVAIIDTVPVTINTDTTGALDIVLGYNFSNSNSSNVVNILTAAIIKE